MIWKGNHLGILIRNREVASSYEYYFSSLWEMAHIGVPYVEN